jgi:hypothetical protein
MFLGLKLGLVIKDWKNIVEVVQLVLKDERLFI